MPRLRAELPPQDPDHSPGSAGRPSGGRSGDRLIDRCSDVGQALAESLGGIVAAVPADARGTVGLARHLAVDKVLVSRVLKALRTGDPIAVLHHLPGPEPLRRLVRAAQSAGIGQALVAAADTAVQRFDLLVREETGDRSTLDAILSGLVPAARVGFELRRKQAAYRAMSQLKGVTARLNVASVLLHPGSDPNRIDVVWIFGTLGIQRLRAGVPIKFASRRLGPETAPRAPRTLRGEPVDAATGLSHLRLDEYCSTPVPELLVQRAGDVLHYTLADEGFGPRSAVDLVFAEVNRNEIDRWAAAAPNAHGRERRTYFFAEVPIPTEALLFDVYSHEAIFGGREPELSVYDTALEGIASPNDPGRDIDRLDTSESIATIPLGAGAAPSSDAPVYATLIADVCARLGWSLERFRGWRTRIDYPMYGSQVTLSFAPPPAPTSAPSPADDAT